MRHVVYASASCVGAPRALCCWRWRWQLTYFCGARLPTQGLNVQVCSLCTASTVLVNDCLISCEPVHVHHKHHHKHCVVGAGAGDCAGDGECLTSCRAGHVSQKGHVTWNGWMDEVLLVFWFLAGKPMLLAGKFTIPIPTQKL